MHRLGLKLVPYPAVRITYVAQWYVVAKTEIEPLESRDLKRCQTSDLNFEPWRLTYLARVVIPPRFTQQNDHP